MYVQCSGQTCLISTVLIRSVLEPCDPPCVQALKCGTDLVGCRVLFAESFGQHSAMLLSGTDCASSKDLCCAKVHKDGLLQPLGCLQLLWRLLCQGLEVQTTLRRRQKPEKRRRSHSITC
jgi:hypothetical protein